MIRSVRDLLRRLGATRRPDPVGPTLILYGRHDCHLCDEAKAVLAALQGRAPFRIEERDVDADPRWVEAYGDEVPVGVIDDRKVFKYRVDPEKLLVSLRRRTNRPVG